MSFPYPLTITAFLANSPHQGTPGKNEKECLEDCEVELHLKNFGSIFKSRVRVTRTSLCTKAKQLLCRKPKSTLDFAEHSLRVKRCLNYFYFSFEEMNDRGLNFLRSSDPGFDH